MNFNQNLMGTIHCLKNTKACPNKKQTFEKQSIENKVLQ
jgi:hypothetical protein